VQITVRRAELQAGLIEDEKSVHTDRGRHPTNQPNCARFPAVTSNDARQRYAQPEGKYPSCLPEDVSLKSAKLPKRERSSTTARLPILRPRTEAELSQSENG
jgi:hypothetical protein